MPDANRAKSGSFRPPAATPPDPRHALAQQYLQNAHTDLAEKEAAAPRARRRAGAANSPAVGFSLSVAKTTFIHLILDAVAVTFAALALVWYYHLLVLYFVAGRIIALPTGVVTFAALAYTSICYLGVIESTSRGHTDVDDALHGDWQEWFWTLPSTVGMLAIAAAVGWGLSMIVPASVWLLIEVSCVLIYPILQLSTLETGTPLAPVSFVVVRSLMKRPVAWFVFYAVSLAVISITWQLGRLAWHDPPYVTMVIMGPIVTVALFIYAWLLGQLARIISTGEGE